MSFLFIVGSINEQFFRIKKPFNLFLYIFIKSSPLFVVVFRRELPEDLFQSLVEDWVAELKHIHRHQKDVDEIICEGPNLLSIDTNTQHVAEHQIIPKDLEVEEYWEQERRFMSCLVHITLWIIVKFWISNTREWLSRAVRGHIQ